MSNDIIEYRLNVLENSLKETQDRTDGKLDSLIQKLGDTATLLILTEKRLASLEEYSKTLSEMTKNTGTDIHNLRDQFLDLSAKIKYKVLPGAVAGGSIAAVIEAIRLLVEKLWQ